jgi:hypothetical protein
MLMLPAAAARESLLSPRRQVPADVSNGSGHATPGLRQGCTACGPRSIHRAVPQAHPHSRPGRVLAHVAVQAAVAIHLLDRNYLVASALARAPHALELQRYLGAWSVGALEDSPIWIFSDDESRPEVAKWAEAVARAMAVFDIAGWVVTAIWGDLSKVVYRCLALAFRPIPCRSTGQWRQGPRR